MYRLVNITVTHAVVVVLTVLTVCQPDGDAVVSAGSVKVSKPLAGIASPGTGRTVYCYHIVRFRCEQVIEITCRRMRNEIIQD